MEGNQRPTFQGNWACSSCQAPINELPFQPHSTDNLLCRDCHSAQRANKPQKQMFEGNWQCKTCGGEITQLPFEPRETGNLVCRNCFMQSKGM